MFVVPGGVVNVRLTYEDVDDASLVHEVDSMCTAYIYGDRLTACSISFDMTSKVQHARPTDEMVTCLWCAVGRWR